MICFPDIRHNGGSMRSNKSSIANSIYSKHEQEALESSWIYVCCSKCRGEELSSSWEPPYWQKICPYPLCPSYRQFARLLSLVLLGLKINPENYFCYCHKSKRRKIYRFSNMGSRVCNFRRYSSSWWSFIWSSSTYSSCTFWRLAHFFNKITSSSWYAGCRNNIPGNKWKLILHHNIYSK